MSVWNALFVITFFIIIISGGILLGLQENYICDNTLSRLFNIFSIAFGFCVVVKAWGLFYEVSYSNLHDLHYEEICNVESISIEENEDNGNEASPKILKVSSLDKKGYLQTKDYPFDPEVNANMNDSNFNISDGYAAIRNSDKKIIEEVTFTRTRNINYYCPLIKNSTEEETITYYIVYYPLDELDVNK